MKNQLVPQFATWPDYELKNFFCKRFYPLQSDSICIDCNSEKTMMTGAFKVKSNQQAKDHTTNFGKYFEAFTVCERLTGHISCQLFHSTHNYLYVGGKES